MTYDHILTSYDDARLEMLAADTHPPVSRSHVVETFWICGSARSFAAIVVSDDDGATNVFRVENPEEEQAVQDYAASLNRKVVLFPGIRPALA